MRNVLYKYNDDLLYVDCETIHYIKFFQLYYNQFYNLLLAIQS